MGHTAVLKLFICVLCGNDSISNFNVKFQHTAGRFKHSLDDFLLNYIKDVHIKTALIYTEFPLRMPRINR